MHDLVAVRSRACEITPNIPHALQILHTHLGQLGNNKKNTISGENISHNSNNTLTGTSGSSRSRGLLLLYVYKIWRQPTVNSLTGQIAHPHSFAPYFLGSSLQLSSESEREKERERKSSEYTVTRASFEGAPGKIHLEREEGEERKKDRNNNVSLFRRARVSILEY